MRNTLTLKGAMKESEKVGVEYDSIYSTYKLFFGMMMTHSKEEQIYFLARYSNLLPKPTNTVGVQAFADVVLDMALPLGVIKELPKYFTWGEKTIKHTIRVCLNEYSSSPERRKEVEEEKLSSHPFWEY